MSLTFYTQSQQMTFVDSTPPYPVVNAWSLSPNHSYDVFFTIQNDTNFEVLGVQVIVTHSPFGIGLPGTTTNIIQPQPVNVPPKGPGGNGLATVMFHYLTPPGGHACLVATIQPNGPSLQQNTDVIAVPTGVTSTLSFLVFGSAVPEVMTLNLTERLETGVAVPPAQKWNPLLVAPSGIGPAVPTPSPINLNLAANGFYSIGLNVTPPLGATDLHIFHIEGTIGAANVGSVDIRVTPSPGVVKPDPYVLGGYQSPDIILYDLTTGIPVPLGGLPGGRWDTTLDPNKDYGFAACVHNASSTPAVNTVVRFWEFWGGVGCAGTLVDVQAAAIPPLSSVIVYSAHPFKSAPAGQHKCAVISLYNSLAGTCPDAVTASQVPDPNANPSHSCSAWRNTDSMIVFSLQPWKIILQVNTPIPDPGPIEVKVLTYHVPSKWIEQDNVKKIATVLEQGGAPRETPLYMLPLLRDTSKPIDLKIVLDRGPMIKLEKGEPGTFTVSGIVPEGVQPGDKLLVHVIASYPQTKESAARAVEFIQILHVEKG
ncbi:MAG: hypothetical protein ABSF99_01040 [Anaerolineales bacterium]